MPIIKFNNYKEPGLSKEILEELQTNLLEMMFPIGSLRITNSAVNPGSEEDLGFGTWERVKGRVLVGLDENDTDFNTIGKTGGEKTHILTINEMPSHTHGLAMQDGSNAGTIDKVNTQQFVSCNWYSHVEYTGGSQAHNNMPPYRVIGYVWIRTT